MNRTEDNLYIIHTMQGQKVLGIGQIQIIKKQTNNVTLLAFKVLSSCIHTFITVQNTPEIHFLRGTSVVLSHFRSLYLNPQNSVYLISFSTVETVWKIHWCQVGRIKRVFQSDNTVFGKILIYNQCAIVCKRNQLFVAHISSRFGPIEPRCSRNAR